MAETVLNPRPHPRILVCVSDSALATQLSFLEGYGGTVQYVDNLSDAYVGEFDLVIVDQPLSHFDPHYGQRVLPSGPKAVYIQPADGSVRGPFDYMSNRDEDAPQGNLFAHSHVPGQEVRMPQGLPEGLQRLVKTVLVDVVEARPLQFGIRSVLYPENGPLAATFRPFLVGPDSLMLAGAYQRATGIDAWVLPGDLPDLKPWLDEAFAEWGKQGDKSFPVQADWTKSEEWRTGEEAAAAAAIDELDDSFQKAETEYQRERASLLGKLAVAEAAGSRGDRRLVFAQGAELEDAVYEALLVFGFVVRNMDETWPTDARREDFRVTRSEETDWLAIVEVTGTTKGVKDEKINSLRDHAEDYMAEEKPDVPPSKWLIVNRELKRDPNTRGSFVRVDRLRTTSKNGVLIVDSVALFKLVRFVQTNPDQASAVREYLRGTTGGIELKDAREWIAEQPSGQVVEQGNPPGR